MKIIRCANYEEMSDVAARLIEEQIAEKKESAA